MSLRADPLNAIPLSNLVHFYTILDTFIRHFSHVTKSRIFKNLNLTKKADRIFRGIFLKNRFRHLKLYLNPQADCPGAAVMWAPFEIQKIEVHILREPTFQIWVHGSSALKKT